MSRGTLLRIGGVSLALLIAVGIFYATDRTQGENSMPGKNSDVSLVDSKSLGALPRKSGSTVNLSHVATGIIPPTNSWISGAVLQATPLPVYPMPLSFLAKNDGFEIGLPTVTSSPTAISGAHVPGMVAAIASASNFQLTRYDKVSATLTYYDSSRSPIGELTLAEGSPFVFFHASSAATLSITGISSIASGSGKEYVRYHRNGHDYIAAAYGGATLHVNNGVARITLPPTAFVTLYSLPTVTTIDSLRNVAGNSLMHVTTSHVVNKQTVTTTLSYETNNHKETAITPMSYESAVRVPAPLFNYDSIYGPMPVSLGSALTTQTMSITPKNQLSLSHITGAHRAQLITLLQKDSATTSITATDSYYAGKQLARAANLLDIAEQLKQPKEIAHLTSVLNSAFSSRLASNYWYYDTALHGVAAQNKSFGSEDFNDHHFHYGYFLYAASILGKYDTTFMQQHAKQVNLLVADIASPVSTTNFPLQRYYDPYVQHSWAAGLAPFSDGNNQESSSEAMNAWNGLAMWGDLIGNASLSDSGRWMLANETATAQNAWRSVDIAAPYLSGYTSPIASLNFGGKRTYATFFSELPSAKLGIQLIPMNPSMSALPAGDKSIGATIKDDNYNVPLGDYILMYLSLSQPKKAEQLLSNQQDTFIDDGNSRTYLSAWIDAQVDK
jgi:endo-1,3(4)-beta-glucanase